MSSWSVRIVLENMSNVDKDYRYMGLSDFVSEIQKPGFFLEPNSESKICEHILKLSEDVSYDTQNLVTKRFVTLTWRWVYLMALTLRLCGAVGLF